ncbi:MAG: DsbA family protein [Patescibacteria group bacterium]
MENQENKKSDYLLPASIIIAALLIGGSWIYTSGLNGFEARNEANQKQEITSPDKENVKSVSAQDHIRGDANAPVKVIEFSDLECPYCKIYHETMQQVVNQYGGKVAWIYRHYPLEQLHTKAKVSALASECAAELGGNEKFWAFIDRYFEVTPSNDEINLTELPNIAADIGLNKNQFENCLNSEKYNSKIEAQIKDATSSGARGTPYSIVIGKNGTKYVVGGAYPMEQLKPIIDQAIGQ